MRPLPEEQRREDPFFAHFPDLKSLLRDRVHGRHAGILRRFAEDSGLMQEWHTDMRYAPGRDIQPRWVARWLADAQRLLKAMNES